MLSQHRCGVNDLNIINETQFKHVLQKQYIQQSATQTFESWIRKCNLIMKETQSKEIVSISTTHGLNVLC